MIFRNSDSLPVKQVSAFRIYRPGLAVKCPLPLFLVPVAAGFPSPAEDYIEGKLDLNKHLVEHPAATFFVRAAGDSMIGAGIHPGDILVVDRSMEPADRKIIIAAVDGELTVKRIRLIEDRVLLVPENRNYCPLSVEKDMDFEVWGVVTNVIHAL